MCSVCISLPTATSALHTISCRVIATETDTIYCAVRTDQDLENNEIRTYCYYVTVVNGMFMLLLLSQLPTKQQHILETRWGIFILCLPDCWLEVSMHPESK